MNALLSSTSWHLVASKNEAPFFARRSLPRDGLTGFDPLSGCMIAHTAAEAAKIDAALASRVHDGGAGRS